MTKYVRSLTAILNGSRLGQSSLGSACFFSSLDKDSLEILKFVLLFIIVDRDARKTIANIL